MAKKYRKKIANTQAKPANEEKTDLPSGLKLILIYCGISLLIGLVAKITGCPLGSSDVSADMWDGNAPTIHPEY